MNHRYVLLLVLLLGSTCLHAQTITLSSPVQFDTVFVNTTDSLAFWVRNVGVTPYIVTDINTTRAEFWVKDTSFTIPANDSTRVFVYFKTNQNVTWKDVLVVKGTGGAVPLQWKGTGKYSDATYNSTQGLWENALKTALTTIVTGQTSLGYNTARDRMFETVDDINLTDTVECVYIGIRIHAVTRTEAQNQNFNTEHTWPQSFFNSAEPMVSDLNHLYPTDAAPNSARANYPFGPVVSNITYNVGGSKLGHRADGATAFEPRDTHKGDVARALFYFMIHYGNPENYMDSTQENDLRVWNKFDPVSAKESQRNTRVASFQGKRNPMIDHPEFADRITTFYDPAAPTLYPDITTSASSISFGTIASGDSVEWKLIIINNGRASMSLTGLTLQTPTSSFKIIDVPTSVPIDSFRTVRLRFTPTQASQTFNNTLVIQSNDPDEGTVNIALTGTTNSTSGQTTLSTPANAATGVPIPVGFIWFRTQTADTYHLQVSVSNTFASFVVNDSTLIDSSASIGGLGLNTVYYWRVRSHTGTGWGSYSTTRSFTTWTTPAQVLAVSPADGATGVAIPSLCTWQSTATATNYQFDLSTSPSFASFVVSDSSLTGTSRSTSGLSLSTQYYWRVRAKNGVGWGSYSTTRNFTTWAPPAQTLLSSPVDGAVDVPIPVVFQWQSTATATKYRFDLATSNTFDTLAVVDSTLTDTVLPVGGLAPNTTYFWRVRAGNTVGWGLYSTARSFTTLSAPAQVQAVSPADGAIDIPIPALFKWQSTATATIYRFDLSTSNTFSTFVVVDSSLTDTVRSVGGLALNTTYYWRVRAGNGAGWGLYSGTRSFTTSSALMVTTQMSTGWNLISVPVTPPDFVATAVFPTAVSSAFAFSNGYVQRDTLSRGLGYWLKFGPSQSVSVTGQPVSPDTFAVNAGWNLIGSISYSVPAASVTSLPPGIIASSFFEFTSGYVSAADLVPMKGYWVRCNQAGQLILQGSAAARPTQSAKLQR